MRARVVVCTALTLAGCAPSVESLVRSSTKPGRGGTASHSAENLRRPPIPLYTYKVVQSWPHHNWAFTEGIVFHQGTLLESSGLYEVSALLKIVPGSGQVIQKREVPEEKAGTDVLNGIAYDAERDRLVVTGKRWPKFFEIRLEEAAS